MIHAAKLSRTSAKTPPKMETKEETIKYQTLDSSLHKVPTYFVQIFTKFPHTL
jgi:hypothetical protein